MSPCFLEKVQWTDNFTPQLILTCTDGDMGQHVFSLEKHNKLVIRDVM